MKLGDLLLGKPLATRDENAERIGAAEGIPIFGLDALSSAAYGPEAAMTLLIPLGVAGAAEVWPITLSIVTLLIIVYFSYRQTIDAYQSGGGSYTVAHENLGPFWGLLAGAALMIDYILVVAVGISAGVGAVVSALPRLQPHTLSMCLGILVVITLVNLRGVRDTGLVFLLPTYLFVATLLIVIGLGLAKALSSGGHPMPIIAPPRPAAGATAVAGLWLLLKAFSSGCTAMTGVEAVSNGVKAFREPTARNAKLSLTVIIALLIVMLAGIAFLARAYGIVATVPGAPGYDSVLSILIAAVAGRGWFYFLTIGSILLVLALSANTAFADFPRLCRSIAFDRYLPHSFTIRGRRLIHTQGVYVLAGFAAVLLIIFGGITDRLIPLFAIGAFLAFTLSQTLLLIPSLLIFMKWVRGHYERVGQEILSREPLDLAGVQAPIVVVPVDRWSVVSRHGLRFALSVSPDVIGLHVKTGEHTDALEKEWCKLVETPVVELGLAMPRLEVLESPYRFVVLPIVDYVMELERKNPDREIAVMVPEMVERRWYFQFLHNQRGNLLKGLLYLKGSERIMVINAPWYLRCT